MADVDTVASVTADLTAEQDALKAVVRVLAPEDWMVPTPSPGWTVADQIAHLTYFDGAAAQAIEDPDAFARVREVLLASADSDAHTLDRDSPPDVLLERWQANRSRLLRCAADLDQTTRLPWYGPPISARSFLAARLMECWAHGQDIVDAVGEHRPATDRLRHIVRLGIATRGWSYANRGLESPSAPVHVVLTSPTGAEWSYGPTEARDQITGLALDFCLVVTQRRHLADTGLRVSGAAAVEWMKYAQSFAGPATDGPPPRKQH